MTYFIKINDDTLIDSDSITALWVNDGDGHVSLRGGERFTIPVPTLQRLKDYLCKRRGMPVFDLDGLQLHTYSFNDED